MIDPTQILIIIVVSSLTVLLIVIGVQIVFILQEVRKSFQKMNKMLDDAANVTGTFSKGITNLSGVTSGLSGFLQVFRIFTKGKDKESHAKRSE